MKSTGVTGPIGGAYGALGKSSAKPVSGSPSSVASSGVARAADEVLEATAQEEVKMTNSQSNNAAPEAAVTSPRAHFSPFKFGFLGGLGVLLAYVAYQSVDTLRSTLIVIAIAALLAIGLDPAVSFLIKRGMKRGLSVMVVMLTVLAFIGGAIYAVVPPIVNEVAAFAGNLPVMLTQLQQNQAIKNLDAKFGLIDQLKSSSLLSSGADGIVSASFTVAGVFVDLLIILILTLYFLAGFPRIKQTAYRLAPSSKRARVSELGEVILKQMGKYLGGATLIAIQAGLVAGVFASIVGLPYPWAIALGAALLDFVPVIGPIVVGVSMMLIGFTQSLTIGIIAAGFYLCQHLFEAYWLYPRVMRRAVNISTGAVVVAIVIGGALLGVTGALMAVPIAAAVQLIFREVILPGQDES